MGNIALTLGLSVRHDSVRLSSQSPRRAPQSRIRLPGAIRSRQVLSAVLPPNRQRGSTDLHRATRQARHQQVVRHHLARPSIETPRPRVREVPEGPSARLFGAKGGARRDELYHLGPAQCGDQQFLQGQVTDEGERGLESIGADGAVKDYVGAASNIGQNYCKHISDLVKPRRVADGQTYASRRQGYACCTDGVARDYGTHVHRQRERVHAQRYAQRAEPTPQAPYLFSTVWSLVKPWLDEATVRKIHILGKNYKSELQTYIAPENLPKDLGGSCTCPGGCSMSDAGPWNKNSV